MKKIILLFVIFTYNLSFASVNSYEKQQLNQIESIIKSDEELSSSDIEKMLAKPNYNTPKTKVAKPTNKTYKNNNFEVKKLKEKGNNPLQNDKSTIKSNSNIPKTNPNKNIKKNIVKDESHHDKKIEDEIREELKNYAIRYKINDTIITNYDVLNRYNLLKAINSLPRFKDDDYNKTIEKVEETIINDEIKHILISERNLNIEDKEVLDFIKMKFKNNLNNLKYFLKNSDISFEYYKKYIQLQLLWRKYVLYYISPKIRIDKTKYEKPQEHKKFSIIQINISPDKNITNQHVSNIIKYLKNGDKFETIAKQYSADKNSKQNGGDIGYKKKSDFPYGISEIIWKLKLNEISVPIQFNNSFIFFKLYDTKTMVPSNVEEMVQNEYVLKVTNSIKSLLSVKKQNIFIVKIEK